MGGSSAGGAEEQPDSTGCSGGSGPGQVFVVMPLDSASSQLLQLSSSGRRTNMPIIIEDVGPNDQVTTYQLSNAIVSGYASTGGGNRPRESVSLSFTKIVWNSSNCVVDSPTKGANAASGVVPTPNSIRFRNAPPTLTVPRVLAKPNTSGRNQ